MKCFDRMLSSIADWQMMDRHYLSKLVEFNDITCNDK